MIKLFKQRTITTAVVVASSLTGCSSFETRMQANDDFDYQNVQLVAAYQTGAFSNDETRTQFDVPVLTESQIRAGHLTEAVDIRPPTQLIPVIDGVLPAAEQPQQTKIWFNAFKQDDDMKAKVWLLLESYLAENDIDIISKDESLQQLETAVYTQKNVYGSFINSNEVLREASYRFTVEEQAGGHSVALNVELLSYSESNDGKGLKFTFTDKSKKNIELRFVNNLLEFAYNEKQANELNNLDSQPLAIKLGFDDNHQTSWIVESKFADTWRKLPDLLSLLHFEIIEADRNLGSFLLKFSAPDDDYWQENNLNPFVLKNAEYFIQLGEMVGDSTSVSWLDADKKPLADQKVTDIYLSISERVHNVLLQKDKQTKAL